MSERKTVFSGFFWRFLERCGAQGVTFIVSLVLARLLAPEVFGTVALVNVIITILNVFVDSGFGTALVQKKDADDLDFSTVFYFNFVTCIVLYLAVFFAAPWIAGFYNDESLVPLVRVISLTLIVSGFKNIQQAYVMRNMMFRKFFFSTIGATLISAVVGITTAYLDWGVWALVAQSLSNAVIATLILFVTVPWKPKLLFSFARFKGLFSFGWKLLVTKLLDTVYNELNTLIIGKFYSKEQLAYFNKSKTFPTLIVNNVNSTIDSVLLPSMANAQDDIGRVKEMTRRSIRASTYLIFPLMMGLAVCSKPLILVLLTEKWVSCVPYMQLFCIYFALMPIHTVNLNAIRAIGRSDVVLKLEIVKKILGLFCIIGGAWIGVLAIAVFQAVYSVLSAVINAWPNRKLLNYGLLEQWKDIFPNLGITIIMGISVYALSWLPLGNITMLAVQVVMGVVIYVGLSLILKLEICQYLLSTVKGFLKKK